MQKLSGVFCAVWTPTDDHGEVLRPALEHNLGIVTQSGVDGLMALGTTAEFPHLTTAQRKSILERLIATNLPVIANVSHVSHHRAIELALHAKQAGARAIAILPPWFFPMGQPDIAEFFIKIAQSAGMPLVLYNYTEMTGKRIEPDTIRRVASTVPLLAIKHSGSDFPYHTELLELAREFSFTVMTGSDTRLEEALQLGCAGTISGLANATAPILRRVFDNFQQKKKSPREMDFLGKLAQKLPALEVPLNVKAALEAAGLQTGSFKNPVSSETIARYESLRDDLKQLFEDYRKNSATT